LELPAKYKYTIYKFRVPRLPSEQEFLNIKATEKIEYLKSIKSRIKKEKRIYIRHHWLSFVTFWISIMLALCTILLILTSVFLKIDTKLGANNLIKISFICFGISIIALLVFQINGFAGSFLSFRRYVKEKFNYSRELKDTIDGCKDYNNFQKQIY